MLVNLSVVQEAFFDEIDFYHLQGSELANSLQALGEFEKNSEITTAVNIEKQIIQQKITTFEQMDIGKLKSDYTRLQHKLETLEQERKSLYGKVVEQDMEINDMLMSFSWRSTAGLRKIKPMLRYLFKRSRVTN
jgi:flagellar motility protein MotE (MotC chaperone)